MAIKSNIQWTDATWNIARGCTKVDEDCKYCYMYRDSFDSTRYNPLQVVRTKTVFDLPLKLKEPSKIFTCSLTDFFHESIDGYRNEAWDIIRRSPQHTFQILTKRPERIADHLPEDWGQGWDNVWLGTSVGSQMADKRIAQLIKSKSYSEKDVESFPARLKFLSLEPLHSHLTIKNYLEYGRIGWVIVGGESGNETGKYRYRPCRIEWIEDVVGECMHFGIPVFVKQLGTYLAKEMKLTDRHGGNIEEWPRLLQVRQFPVLNTLSI